MHCLQNYITDYRTHKARHDLAFTEKLYGEAKASYEDAQLMGGKYRETASVEVACNVPGFDLSLIHISGNAYS